ncbi:class I SAM-dependent methyltransferase [Janibacter terrae]|uniref:class I SAM-dependent methyltransferase n=1 Tax=Janibacter terrae TaxID=103817 RepID=UPI00382BD0FF
MPSDLGFAGSVPYVYDTLLVPLMFLDYAEDVALAVAATAPDEVLETAAGTGVVTRALHRALPSARITATDLSPAMLDRAAHHLPASESVTWAPADAHDLPFDDDSFDALVCQFGVMFLDRPRAHAEARRVLRPGGRLVLAAWGRLEDNEAALGVQEALEALLPDDPPLFLRRVPFGYTDVGVIRAELEDAGLTDVDVRVVAHRNRPVSAHDIALAHCQGTPVANILAERQLDAEQVTEDMARLLRERWGDEPVSGPITAHLVTATA